MIEDDEVGRREWKDRPRRLERYTTVSVLNGTEREGIRRAMVVREVKWRSRKRFQRGSRSFRSSTRLAFVRVVIRMSLSEGRESRIAMSETQ